MKNLSVAVRVVFVPIRRGLAQYRLDKGFDAEPTCEIVASPRRQSGDSSIKARPNDIRCIPRLTTEARLELSRSAVSERHCPLACLHKSSTSLTCPSKSKYGFTLLEVLLTSLLASVVLVSLWALSDIYLKLFAVGKLKIEETQIVRGLTEKIASDVTQVVQISKNESESKSGRMLIQVGRIDPLPLGVASSTPIVGPRPRPEGPPNGLPPFGPPPGLPPIDGRAFGLRSGDPQPVRSREPIRSQVTGSADPSTAVAEQPSDRTAPKFGLFGTSDALRLIILQTDPRTARDATDLLEVIPQAGQTRPAVATELRTIEYTFSRAIGSASDTRQRPAGLLRREWAWETWVGLKYASTKPTDDSTYSDMLPDSNAEWTEEDAVAFEAGRNILHIPQVVDIEFYYYDGSSWDIEWNSWERGRLPQLVEVTLQIKVGKDESASKVNAEAANDDANSLDDGITSVTSGKVYRRLIHLPFAEPTPPSSDLDRHSGPDEMANTNLPRLRQP